MKVFIKSTVFFIAVISGYEAFAGGQHTGTVNHLLVHWNGNNISKFDVSLTGLAESQPDDCSSNKFSATLDTEAAKAQYSLLLAASISSKEITIQGQGSCYGTNEEIRNVYINIK